MSSESRPAERRPPPGPCVWMAAGLLAYKLCDREFECESCPLDAALRGDTPLRPGLLPRRLSAAAFPDDRLYHPAHLWVADLGGRQVRCGLDALAARLLSRITSLVLPVAGNHVSPGRPVCWALDEEMVVPLRAPVCGIVRRANRLVHDDGSLAVEEPYDRGWLMEIRCERPLDSQPELADPATHFEMVNTKWNQVERRVATCPSAAEVGPTLADGGEPLNDLRRIMGHERYSRLVRSLLS